jgi:hypothetical protein|tara:strand:- start:460 stop:660 length:201 start_codon:yes stop_codon:yes gene_type:complete
MTLFYFLVALFLLLVAYAGIEETMRLVSYADLQVKYAYVKVRMYYMRKRLEKQLGKPPKDWRDFNV